MLFVKYLAQTICVCCFIAAFLRAGFPEGNLKPVINTVLALYILANVLRLSGGVDTQQLYYDIHTKIAAQQPPADYSEYTARLYDEAAAESGAEK